MRTRKTYPEEFKREAVRLSEERGNVSQVAKDLNIDQSMLSKWKKAAAAGDDRVFPGRGNVKDMDRDSLERENARLREEVEILKKAVGIFTTRPR